MIFLNKKEVIDLNKSNIEKYGGSFGIRDDNLLGSSIYAPQHYYFYNQKEDNIFLKVAYKCIFSIIKNHPFLDGNKRTGFSVMMAFLKFNNISIKLTQKDVEENSIRIANDEILEEEFVKWLKNNKVL